MVVMDVQRDLKRKEFFLNKIVYIYSYDIHNIFIFILVLFCFKSKK